MTLHISFMSKLIRYCTVLGSSFDRMHFACFFLFFCVYVEKDIRRNYFKPSHEGLHLDQHPRELVYLKNGRISTILLKSVCSLPKA